MLYRKEMWETKEGRAWILKTQIREAVGFGLAFEEIPKYHVSHKFIDTVKREYGLSDDDILKIYKYYKSEISYDELMNSGSKGLREIFSSHRPLK